VSTVHNGPQWPTTSNRRRQVRCPRFGVYPTSTLSTSPLGVQWRWVASSSAATASPHRDATTGPQTIASLSVLNYVAKRCVAVGARVVVPVRQPEVWLIAADIVKTEYKLAGKGDEFDPECIQFLSNQ